MYCFVLHWDLYYKFNRDSSNTGHVRWPQRGDTPGVRAMGMVLHQRAAKLTALTNTRQE